MFKSKFVKDENVRAVVASANVDGFWNLHACVPRAVCVTAAPLFCVLGRKFSKKKGHCCAMRSLLPCPFAHTPVQALKAIPAGGQIVLMGTAEVLSEPAKKVTQNTCICVIELAD